MPRQRGALRMVQVTLLMLAGFAGKLAVDSISETALHAEGVVLAVLAVLGAGGALWMGLRTVRGPQPPGGLGH